MWFTGRKKGGRGRERERESESDLASFHKKTCHFEEI